MHERTQEVKAKQSAAREQAAADRAQAESDVRSKYKEKLAEVDQHVSTDVSHLHARPCVYACAACVSLSTHVCTCARAYACVHVPGCSQWQSLLTLKEAGKDTQDNARTHMRQERTHKAHAHAHMRQEKTHGSHSAHT